MEKSVLFFDECPDNTIQTSRKSVQKSTELEQKLLDRGMRACLNVMAVRVGPPEPSPF